MISGTSTAPLIRQIWRKWSDDEFPKAGDLNATADYRPSTAALDVTLHQDDNHQLRLSGIPQRHDWATDSLRRSAIIRKCGSV
jgi:hypothetical protein